MHKNTVCANMLAKCRTTNIASIHSNRTQPLRLRYQSRHRHGGRTGMDMPTPVSPGMFLRMSLPERRTGFAASLRCFEVQAVR